MKSIRAKLWLGMMVLVGTIIILLWLFQIVFLDQFYTALEIGAVTKRTESIAVEIAQLDDIDQITDADQVTDLIETFVYEKQLSVIIINSSNNTIYENATGSMNMSGMFRNAVYEATTLALAGTKNNQEVIHPKFGYRFMIIAIPIIKEGIVQGTMAITVPMANVEDTVDILKKQLVLLSLILLLVSIFLSFLLSKRFTKPILQINQAAKSYAAGDYTVRINNTDQDELGQLAARMNDMGEALAQNERLQKELIANVSHELRTPLTLIRGYAETLRDVTGHDPQKREKQLGIILDESERLSGIVDDILNLSRLQSGAVLLEQAPFELKQLLNEIQKRYEVQQEVGTFQIIGITELKEKVIGDRKKLEQVFYNLIGNAYRYNKEGTLVEINCIIKEKSVRIEVRDTGGGIAKEDLEHIFERYYKGKNADVKSDKGSGLGLAIVKSIMEMHQVPFDVESELGKGTTFWFELNMENSRV